MTAPKVCEYCGACLDAGETCDCKEKEENKKMEIIDFRGERREIKTNTLSDIYKVFEPYGLTLSEEEKKLINGTHEIYEERE